MYKGVKQSGSGSGGDKQLLRALRTAMPSKVAKLPQMEMSKSMPALVPGKKDEKDSEMSEEDVLRHIGKLRKRHDDLTAECQVARMKLHQLKERTNGFTPTADLDANKDEDAAEIAVLEAELADVLAQTDVANHDARTYALMIDRLHEDEKTWRRDLNEIDIHTTAKRSDSRQLHLMLKDAIDVRDAAKAELQREDESLSEEIAAHTAKLEDKQAKLNTRRRAAAEHAKRTEEKLRALEAQRDEAIARREQIASVGSFEDEREKIAKLQGIFDQIAEVIGVSEADLIVEKFKAQEETYSLLANLHRTSRARIDELLKQRDSKHHELMQIRYASQDKVAQPAPEKPRSTSNPLALAAEEEEKQKEERAKRMRASRAKRMTTILIEANHAMASITNMLRAAKGMSPAESSVGEGARKDAALGLSIIRPPPLPHPQVPRARHASASALAPSPTRAAARLGATEAAAPRSRRPFPRGARVMAGHPQGWRPQRVVVGLLRRRVVHDPRSGLLADTWRSADYLAKGCDASDDEPVGRRVRGGREPSKELARVQDSRRVARPHRRLCERPRHPRRNDRYA